MKAVSTAASATRHTMLAALEAMVIVAVVAALMFAIAFVVGRPTGAGVVLAANGATGSGGAWIALNQPNQLSVSGTNTATFSIGQKRTSEPWVRVRCNVNGVLAYSQLLGYFPTYPYGEVFTFDSNYLQWNYGNLPLQCSARLEYRDSKGTEHVMASTDFVVNP
jgi:hypothetical protein